MTDQRHVDALHGIIRTLSNLDPMQMILVVDLIEKAKRALEEPVGPIVDAEATETILELEMPPYRLFGVPLVQGARVRLRHPQGASTMTDEPTDKPTFSELAMGINDTLDGIIAAVAGYRAKATEAGFSDAAAEQMALDYHRELVRITFIT